ncbi:MAG: hypothetical protein L0H96_26015 [Humibacillus sp.]|nr:hypothetical protein [Humibacillus sp.]
MHHGALACLLGINALRASEAAAERIEDYADTLRGYRVLHLVGNGNKPATMEVTVPVLRALEACLGQRTTGPFGCDRSLGSQSIVAMCTGLRRRPGYRATSAPHSLRHAGIINALDAGVPHRDAQIPPRRADPRTTEH